MAVEPTSVFGAALLKIFVDLMPAAIGAFISMRFIPQTLTRAQKVASIFSAWAVGTYFGRGIASYLNITNPHIADAILFGVALFGLSFAGTVIQELKPIIQAATRRWIGPLDKQGDNHDADN